MYKRANNKKKRTYVEVALEGGAGFGLLVAGIGTARLLKTVAVVPRGAVLRPGTHANPAELVFTLAARHMVTSSVLLDGRLTFAALLRMR